MPSAERLGVQTCCALRDSLEQRAEWPAKNLEDQAGMNLDHLRPDQVSSDQFRSEIWQSHMRFSSANVIDAPRTGD